MCSAVSQSETWREQVSNTITACWCEFTTCVEWTTWQLWGMYPWWFCHVLCKQEHLGVLLMVYVVVRNVKRLNEWCEWRAWSVKTKCVCVCVCRLQIKSSLCIPESWNSIFFRRSEICSEIFSNVSNYQTRTHLILYLFLLFKMLTLIDNRQIILWDKDFCAVKSNAKLHNKVDQMKLLIIQSAYMWWGAWTYGSRPSISIGLVLLSNYFFPEV